MFTELPRNYGDSVTTTCPMCHKPITVDGLSTLPFAEQWDRHNLRHFDCCDIYMAVYLKRERGWGQPPTLVVEPEN